MKKLVFALLFVAGITSMANAQWSAQAGLNNAFYKIKYDSGYLGGIGGGSATGSDLGVFFGGAYDMDLSEDEINLQFSALLSFVSGLTSLYLPALVQYEVADSFKVVGGPQIHMVLSDIGEAGTFGVDLALGGQYDIDDTWYVFARFAFEILRGNGDLDFVNQSFNSLLFGVGYRFDN